MTAIKRLFVTYPSLRKFWKELEESPFVFLFWFPGVVIGTVLLVMIVSECFK